MRIKIFKDRKKARLEKNNEYWKTRDKNNLCTLKIDGWYTNVFTSYNKHLTHTNFFII